MSNVLRSLIVRVGADIAGAQKGFQQLSKDARAAGKELTDTGREMTRNVTLPILAAGGASIKFALDFEESMAKVGTIADTSKISLDDLKNGILDISNSTGIAATELNNALYETISSNVDTADSLDLVQVAAKSAIGGFTDVTTAVDGLTSVLNSYGIETAKADKIANLFFIAQDKGKTTFGELAQSIGQVAPIANQSGFKINELLASIASLTSSGIETSEAVTGIRSALTNIIDPTDEAIKKAKELAIDFSVTALQSKGFSSFLQEVKEKTNGSAEDMAKLFGNVRALNAVMSLTSTTGANMLNSTLLEMETNLTAVDDAFTTMNDNAANQFKITVNEVKNLGINVGKLLLPSVTNATKGVNNLVDKFINLNDNQKKAIVYTAGIAAAIGPAMTISGKMSKTISELAGNFAKAGKALNSGDGFTGAINAFLGPGGTAKLVVSGIVVAVGALTIAYREATKEQREFKEEAKGVADAFYTLKDANNIQLNELEANVQLTGSLTEELFKLNKQEQLSATEKARLKSIVEQLNSMYNGLNLSIDLNTGRLIQNENAVRMTIESMQELTKYKALEAQWTEYEKTSIDLQNKRKEAIEKIAVAYKMESDEISESWLQLRKYENEVSWGLGKQQLLIESLIEIDSALASNDESLKNTKDAWSEMTEAMTTNSAALASNMEYTQEQLQTMVDAIILGSEELTEEAKLTQVAFNDVATANYASLNLTQEQLNTLFEMYNTTYDEAQKDYEKYIADVEAATERHYTSMGGLFDKVPEAAETSKQELVKILQEQITAFQNWDSDLDNIAARVTEDGKSIVDGGLINELRQLGPKAAGQIQAMSTMTDTELTGYVELWRKKNTLAKEAAIKELSGIPGEVQTILTNVNLELQKTKEIKDTSFMLGQTIINGLESGMDSRLGSLKAAARAAARAALAEIRAVIQPGSPSKVTTVWGRAIADGITLGIDQGRGDALKASANLAYGAMASFQSMNLSIPALATGGHHNANMSYSAPVYEQSANGSMQSKNERAPVIINNYRPNDPYGQLQAARKADLLLR